MAFSGFLVSDMVDLDTVIDFIVRRNNSDFDACGFLMQLGF